MYHVVIQYFERLHTVQSYYKRLTIFLCCTLQACDLFIIGSLYLIPFTYLIPHPTPLPFGNGLLFSVSMHLFLSCYVGSLCFLYSICNFIQYLSLPDFTTHNTPGSSTLSQTARFHSFSWLSMLPISHEMFLPGMIYKDTRGF